jgi:hypothetical protein
MLAAFRPEHSSRSLGLRQLRSGNGGLPVVYVRAIATSPSSFAAFGDFRGSSLSPRARAGMPAGSGKPMLSKSLLHWPATQIAKPNDAGRESMLPVARYNSFDTQASMPDDSDSFNALWHKRFIDAVGR